MSVPPPSRRSTDTHFLFVCLVADTIQGLPDTWTKLLTGSAITKEDYANNPEAVLEVLEFYTDQTKRNEEEYGTASLIPNSLPVAPSEGEVDRWANLMPKQQAAPPRPLRPDDRPYIPERSQSVDNLAVTQRMSSLAIYDDKVRYAREWTNCSLMRCLF